MLETPVTLIMFNRPNQTEKVFQAIARAKPRKLFIVADGPRPNRPEDVELCAATRAVVENVDWECDVRRNYAAANIGCTRRPPSGISWMFEQVDRSIILEDDCVPDPSFFPFCQELLERYKDDERVMQINGSNFLQGKPVPTSYYFSRFPTCWGWATWRRSWQHYDISVRLWSEFRGTSWLRDIVEHPDAVDYWAPEFERAYQLNGEIGTWDHQWGFACWAHSGLAITPRLNLVSNIGCDGSGTHCGSGDARANLRRHSVKFPLLHPANVLRSVEQDKRFIHEVVVSSQQPPRPSITEMIKSRISALLPQSLVLPLRRALRRSIGVLAVFCGGEDAVLWNVLSVFC